MAGEMDEMKGRAKEAVGALTDDDSVEGFSTMSAAPPAMVLVSAVVAVPVRAWPITTASPLM